MKEIQVTLTIDELQDLWFATTTAHTDALLHDRMHLAKAMNALTEKLYNILTNPKTQKAS